MNAIQVGLPLVKATCNLVLLITLVVLFVPTTKFSQAYQLGQRWNTTASGATGALGSPVTLTWSFVPDGTSIDALSSESDLIAFLDATLGGGTGALEQRPWFTYFESSFDRWSQLGGVTYIYEPNDDGVNVRQPPSGFPGVLGVRGDIRIAGGSIDGGGSVLGFNYSPNHGDMVLDTNESDLVMDPAMNHLGLRWLVSHEHGHGLGLSHVESATDAFLMERVINLSYDGPQLDDIRGLHRAYGDVWEKTNNGQGNNSAANATPLGMLTSGGLVSIGTDAGPDTFVAPTDVDFVSIDDNSDFDFFSFEVSAASLVDLILTPHGPTYSEGPAGGIQQPLDSAAVSDLTLALFDRDGITPLRIVNAAGAGENEQILGFELPSAGQYFARVTGLADDVQLYQLDVTALTVPEPSSLLLLLAGLLLVRRSHR